MRSDTDITLTCFPRMAAIFLITFFTTGLTTFKSMSANGFASSADVVATAAIDPVVVIIPALGMLVIICCGIDRVSVTSRHLLPTNS